MGTRERRRAERQKRKQRSAERQAAMAARYAERNREAREKLKPLEEGERPLVMTIGAVVSALMTASIVIAYAAGAEVSGDRPNVLQVIAPSVLFGVMAWGLWKARYWALLGFQTVLLLVILLAAIGLVGATRWQQAIGTSVLIIGASALFYFNIKAMARIQMPERLPKP
jgi:hypothetical protein